MQLTLVSKTSVAWSRQIEFTETFFRHVKQTCNYREHVIPTGARRLPDNGHIFLGGLLHARKAPVPVSACARRRVSRMRAMQCAMSFSLDHGAVG